MNKILIFIIIGLIVVVGGFFLLNNYVYEEKQADPIPPSSIDREPVTVTIRGEITCLPKVGSGAQTLECAIGLKGQDGKYYALENLSVHDPDYSLSATGTNVEVTGMLHFEERLGPDGNRYDIAGVIAITSIQEAM